MVAGGRMRGRDRSGVWMNMDTWLYLKCVTNKDVPRNTGKSSQSHVYPGREQGLGESGHRYACLSPFTAT